MTKGSIKGFNFEREICKKLSLWWTEFERDDVFWRTSGSGGRATTRLKQGKLTANSYGDAAAIDPIGQPFIDVCFIEIKRGYSSEVSILDFIDRKKGQPLLMYWWENAKEKIEVTGQKYVILIFKRDRHETCVMISSLLFNCLSLWMGDLLVDNIRIDFPKQLGLVVISFQDFLNWVSPSLFTMIKEGGK